MIIDRPEAAHIPALRQLWQQAFGDTDAFLDGFFATGYSPQRCRCLHINGQLAAALYWFDCTWRNKKVAYIYAVATAAAFQGRGLCRALMENTHLHLKVTGYAGSALVPGSPELFALYQKLGYRSFCPMRTITLVAGKRPAAIQPICKDHFLLHRRSFLPENALLQEGETLDFLATFADFYKSGDAIFAVSRENNTLYFQEYLGDSRDLGGIIAALKADKGVVRLPGSNMDTAMYLSLEDDPALPDYLGLPLN